MKHQLSGAAFQPGKWNLVEQGNRVVVEFSPAHRVQVAEQTGGILIPAPPQIAGERPELLLGRGDKAVERASFADDRRDLGGGFAQHLDFVIFDQ